MDQAVEELRAIEPGAGPVGRLPWSRLYGRFVAWTWPVDLPPPANITTRVALSWVMDPSNRRAALLVRRHGALGALNRLLASTANPAAVPEPPERSLGRSESFTEDER